LGPFATRIDTNNKCEGRTLFKKTMCNGLAKIEFSANIYA
jgi:hypothetical protein